MSRKPPTDTDGPKLVVLPGRGRPEPPEKLTQAEQKAWRAVVDASPDGFLDGAAQLVLKHVVTQLSVADRHAERLRRMVTTGGELEDELEVAKAHREAMKAVIAGMTTLRVTPRSRIRIRTAGNAFAASPSGRRPWDPIQPGGSETDNGETPA